MQQSADNSGMECTQSIAFNPPRRPAQDRFSFALPPLPVMANFSSLGHLGNEDRFSLGDSQDDTVNDGDQLETCADFMPPEVCIVPIEEAVLPDLVDLPPRTPLDDQWSGEWCWSPKDAAALFEETNSGDFQVRRSKQMPEHEQ